MSTSDSSSSVHPTSGSDDNISHDSENSLEFVPIVVSPQTLVTGGRAISSLVAGDMQSARSYTGQAIKGVIVDTITSGGDNIIQVEPAELSITDVSSKPESGRTGKSQPPKTTTRDRGSSGGSGGSGGGKGSPPRGGIGSNDLGGDPFHLTNLVPPVEVRLSSGIKPNCYGSDIEYGFSGLTVPLHISFAKMQLPMDATYLPSLYYYNTILPSLLARIQGAISFQLPPVITNVPTPSDNLTVYFNKLFEALQVYFFFQSLFQIKSVAILNEGLKALSNNLTAADYMNFLMLEKNLQIQAIPPNMKELCYYMNQNFRSSSLPASPIIKIVPVGFVNYMNYVDSSMLTTCISNLTTTTNMQVASILRKACPNWVPKSWEYISPFAIHDNNFSTIYANLPVWGQNTSGTTYNFKGPASTGTNIELAYNTYTDSLDGVAYAMFGYWYSTGSTWLPSLMQPFQISSSSTSTTNRLSWYNSGSGSTWVDPFMSANTVVAVNRGETACYNANYNDSIQNFGTEYVWGVTGNSVMQTTAQVLQWMFSLDTIKPVQDKRYGGGKR